MEGGRQADIAKGILAAKNVPYVVAAPLLIQACYLLTAQPLLCRAVAFIGASGLPLWQQPHQVSMSLPKVLRIMSHSCCCKKCSPSPSQNIAAGADSR